jgi:signal transduction histidine kinase
MWGATRQLGPFVVPADADVVLSLQIYWIMICLPVMLLAAAIREREVVEAALDDQRNQLARVTRIATAGELSGALAHELRQPMTAILANAQAGLLLLAREPADLPQIREILEDIASQDRQAGEVIARIRALLGGATSRREPVALESVVQDALSLTSQTAADANVRVQADVAAGLPPVRGDQVQLLQLLVNLVVNGCESMTDTAVTNRVLKLRVGRVGSDRLQVSVADSGVARWTREIECSSRSSRPRPPDSASACRSAGRSPRRAAGAGGGRTTEARMARRSISSFPRTFVATGDTTHRRRSEGGGVRTRVCFKCWCVA